MSTPTGSADVVKPSTGDTYLNTKVFQKIGFVNLVENSVSMASSTVGNKDLFVGSAKDPVVESILPATSSLVATEDIASSSLENTITPEPVATTTESNILEPSLYMNFINDTQSENISTTTAGEEVVSTTTSL